MRQRKGQSTLEYIIVLTAIIGIILIAANGFIKERMENILRHAGQEAEDAVAHIDFGGAD